MTDKFDKDALIQASFHVMRSTRLMAKAVDLSIVSFLAFIAFPFGFFAGFTYLFVCDYINQGQSLGKKYFGMRVISLEDGLPCSLKQSGIRNLPLLVPFFFFLFPVWGWTLSILLAIPLVSLEIYLLFTLDSGNRLGDVMAETTVMANTFESAYPKKLKNSWFRSQHSLSRIRLISTLWKKHFSSST
jgi:uncharacterized RDD family membrane protein YckC